MKMKLSGLFILFSFIFFVARVMAVEEAPFFVGEISYPNVFIIFDNSDSMQDVPYLNQSGTTVRPYATMWKMDIWTTNGSPVYNNAGNLQWITWNQVSALAQQTRTNGDRKASGGDHPASKLYQAKQALNQILPQLENVNLGFATYLSFRTPSVYAIYYKIDTGFTYPDQTNVVPTQWRAVYRRSLTHFVSNNTWPSRDTLNTWWGGIVPTDSHYNLFVGAQFTRYWTDSISPAVAGCASRLRQNLVYTVTDIHPTYGGDGQFLGYQWSYNAPYYDYEWRYYNQSSYPTCASLPYTDGVWTRVNSTTCNPCSTGTCGDCVLVTGYTYITTGATVPNIYRFQWGSTIGSWDKPPGVGGYINPTTLEVTPSLVQGSWLLLQSTLNNVIINTAGGKKTVAPARYPGDTFSYPGVGTPDRPHAWSYVKKTANWPLSILPTPYFPALVGDEKGNQVGNDHIIFVNLPLSKPIDQIVPAGDPRLGQTYLVGDDTGGVNKNKILSFISLERYSTHPRYGGVDPVSGSTYNYDYTTLPFTSSIPPNTTTAVYGKATPLAATLQYLKRYYESYIAQDSRTQDKCRDNFAILLTDGLETCDGDPASAAAELRAIGVKTYVIGFGMSPVSDQALNAIAYAGGTVQAYYPTTMAELVATLNAIFQEITQNQYSRSDPVMTRSGDRIYTAWFKYPGWEGHLTAYTIELPSGGIGTAVTDWNSSGDAGININNQISRTIYTTIQGPGVLNPTRISFSTSSPDNTAILKPYVNPLGEDINGNSIPDELADAAAVIEFTRDPGYAGGIYKGTRNPNWKLSDIYHSTPVVVEAPPIWQAPYPNDHDYCTYRAEKEGRDRVIYVGSNGGMLHCINDSDGKERWAFIPRAVLGNLRNMRIEHQWGVDARPVRAEIWSRGGSGTCFPYAAHDKDGWHTVLVFGLRQGGRSYVALDVTDPSDPKILWEFTDSNLGETWSTPAFGLVKVKIGSQVKEKPVVFVGGGYSTTSDVGNRLYIIDIETGQTLTDGANVAEFTIGDSENKVPGAIRECDYNKDGFIERIYFGDIQGRVWKIDLSDNRINKWTPCVLLDPDTYNWSTVSPEPSPHPTRRPIFIKPAYAKGDSGNYFVFVGTGDERNPNASETRDFFYEIEDLPGDCSAKVNWVKVLPVGEKVLSNPAWFDYIIYFTTYKPAVACGAGVGYIYGLTMSRGAQSQGGGQAGIVYDLQGNPIEGGATERLSLGIGVPSAPLITNGIIYVVTSNNIGTAEAIHEVTINPVGGMIRAWRERF